MSRDKLRTRGHSLQPFQTIGAEPGCQLRNQKLLIFTKLNRLGCRAGLYDGRQQPFYRSADAFEGGGAAEKIRVDRDHIALVYFGELTSTLAWARKKRGGKRDRPVGNIASAPMEQPDITHSHTVGGETFLDRLASLSDAVRVRVLHVLGRHELGVAELCDVVQLPQSTVSRHLKALAEQQWIVGRREGTNRLYRMISDELEPAARKLWVVARDQTDAWPAVKQDRLRLERVLRDRDVDGPAFFESAAGEWDRLRRELYGERFSVAAMLSLLPAGTVVVDLGCGSGNLTFELAPFVKTVIGVDSSAAMLKAAKRRTAGLGNVDLRRGDLSAVPVDSSSCDSAVMVLALTYVPDPAAVVAEMARVLKPAGRGVIVDLLPHDRDDFRRRTGQVSLGLDTDRIVRWMTDAGMTGVATRPLEPEPNVKGPALFIAAGVRRSV
jgi:ubiquinone/menaquinone biosynthesis C-methylase UbiE/DNA-binding transcriptional ArsR family regulator